MFDFLKLIFRPEIFSYPQRAKFRLKSRKYFYAGFASNFSSEMPFWSQTGPNYKCSIFIKLIFRPELFSYPQRAKFWLKTRKCFYAGFASNFGSELPFGSQTGPNYKCSIFIKLIFRPEIFSYPQKAKFRRKSRKYFYAGFASNFGSEMPLGSQTGPNYKCSIFIKLIFRPEIIILILPKGEISAEIMEILLFRNRFKLWF